MERLLVYWKMMEFPPIKTLALSYVILVMSQLTVTLESVRVMGAGVVMRPCVEEVSIMVFAIQV